MDFWIPYIVVEIDTVTVILCQSGPALVFGLYGCTDWVVHICLIFLLILLDGIAVVLIADLVLSMFMISSGYSVIFLVILIADLVMVLLGM